MKLRYFTLFSLIVLQFICVQARIKSDESLYKAISTYNFSSFITHLQQNPNLSPAMVYTLKNSIQTQKHRLSKCLQSKDNIDNKKIALDAMSIVLAKTYPVNQQHRIEAHELAKKLNK